MILPGVDGRDHINVYSKGKTKLGRMLSNWSEYTVEFPEAGLFRCLEGYWFWLGTGDGALRNMSGWEAKNYGKTHARVNKIEANTFMHLIMQAMQTKVRQHHEIQIELEKSELPFCHYYEYGGKKIDAGYEWITTEWELIRSGLKLKT
jgi:hypothetical protein